MLNHLTLRPATASDVPNIVQLLYEDEIGITREFLSDPLLPSYYEAFQDITEDKNQILLVVEYKDEIVGTCQLTCIPSLSYKGSKRLNIENVHVKKRVQGQGVGTWMIKKAIELGRERGCKSMQLTTNKRRPHAKAFYEKLGFKASHEGMKLSLDHT